MQKQYKALSGGGVSIASIAMMLIYLNNTLQLGLGPEVITAASGLIGLLIYLVVYFVPNINRSMINIDEVDVEAVLTLAAKDTKIPPGAITVLAKFVKDNLKEAK